jgi:hypothetical protein
VPGASLVRFVALAAFIASVGLALWLLDLGPGWVLAGVVAAWLVTSLIEWIARSGVQSAPRLVPGARPAVPLARAAEDAPSARSFRLLGLRVTVRKKRTEEVPPPQPATTDEEARPAPGPEPARAADSEPEPVASVQPGDHPGDGRRDGGEARRWNLWDLERAARENGGRPAAELEERSLLLLHLRQFASADGFLPAEFDGLVRESFPALTGELEQA